uniref:TPR_REGION domain-containing protein n=1 Tax=Mesocestoides corti TaxID=53468 RepID=A0A5K3EPW7_MESCO
MYICLDKLEIAIDLLKRCLQFNQSCYQAYEFMGVVMEKNASFEEAAKQYHAAWEILKNQDPAIGYKLALNYLKAKDYFRAVDVCHQVLTIAPNYPLIQTTILRRALDALRT